LAKNNKDEVAPEEKVCEFNQEVKEQTERDAQVEQAGQANEIKELEDKLADNNDRLLRLAAEYDNFRKRTQREKEELFLSSKVSIISELLPVLDNFERASQNSESNAEDYKKGVEMTFNQFAEIMKKLGVEPFGAVGEKFDPNMHNAVMHIQDDNLSESEIAEVFVKGYKIGDKIIRFATVKVAN
jgi:molecular chaperone GrpE